MEVAGTAIVDNLCDTLEAIGIEELIVVTGHNRYALMQHLSRRSACLRVRCVDNAHFAGSNNIVSLWCARKLICPPFLLLECDVFMERSVLAPLMIPDRMIVSAYADHMNGTAVQVAESGKVTRMVLGEQMAEENPALLRKTVNLYSLSRTSWTDHVEPAVCKLVDAGHLDVFYEAALVSGILSGDLCFTAIDVSGLKWIEIDSPRDLALAEAMFSEPVA